jgi:hypothetical protein
MGRSKLKTSNEVAIRLEQAKSLHGFLGSLFQGSGEAEPALFSFAEFARRAGLSSRSLPREIMLQKRSLSHSSRAKFIKGLGLDGHSAKIFSLLAMQAYPGLNTDGLSEPAIETQLATLRQKLQARQHRSAQVSHQTDIFRLMSWPFVFAALGSPQAGASLDEIISRTGLSRLVCDKTLEELLKRQIVSIKDGRFYALDGHMLFSELNKDGQLQKFYLQNLRRAEAHAETDFVSQEALHFTSVLSVSRERLPALRKELLKTAIDFVEKAEEPTGNSVVAVVVAMA